MIYKHTARKGKDKNETVYAIGRVERLHGQPPEEGGYIVWVRRANYSGTVSGGLAYTWRYVKKDLGYVEAVKLFNKRLKRKEFIEKLPEK